jgi:hypothetical protein
MDLKSLTLMIMCNFSWASNCSKSDTLTETAVLRGCLSISGEAVSSYQHQSGRPTILAADYLVSKAEKCDFAVLEVDVQLFSLWTKVVCKFLEERRTHAPAIVRCILVKKRMHNFSRFVSQLVGFSDTYCLKLARQRIPTTIKQPTMITYHSNDEPAFRLICLVLYGNFASINGRISATSIGNACFEDRNESLFQC